MTHPDWKIGTLRLPEYGYDFGHIVFYRPYKLKQPLAVGPAFWVKFQGSNQIFSFTETYSGPNLNKMVAPMRDSKGYLKDVPSHVASKLEELLKTFIQGLPIGARIKRPSEREDKKVSLKRSNTLAK